MNVGPIRLFMSYCEKNYNFIQSRSWRNNTRPQTSCRGINWSPIDVLFEGCFFNINFSRGEGSWLSRGGHSYALRLSMIKSGSCCFSQYLDGAQHRNNAENHRVPLIWVWEGTRLAMQNYCPGHHSNY